MEAYICDINGVLVFGKDVCLFTPFRSPNLLMAPEDSELFSTVRPGSLSEPPRRLRERIQEVVLFSENSMGVVRRSQILSGKGRTGIFWQGIATYVSSCRASLLA
ncbi:hypothetical protein Pla100_43830 [Neorhodopirellula pilleata]|uniref:Uncharacterized protein n=1 Tax=Neorhodopirellula pilleata TaxID=2714738 RepID=A0A5C6A0W7_9BACT|nr:hypothetical protein Pla100_43830 [Neorhodopirellula pilleata]